MEVESEGFKDNDTRKKTHSFQRLQRELQILRSSNKALGQALTASSATEGYFWPLQLLWPTPALHSAPDCPVPLADRPGSGIL